ncbi:hypothetical protein [Limoniibacter endophyticus]|uniref:Uncharacterized protein n=1 Tax=Limoniibacter endophyticus TaxID=1565040 RepID=A0A8J3DM74_9HYPH|nr:hypothetical protein [Limoniibacter endophyticus]GHC66700.1 hypothetical protein GCM10010136_10000 [Limoniibacter endophyticus]
MQQDKHAPDSLKYQWRVLSLVVRSRWATGLDKSVAFEIIDNYRKEFKNSRTSLSYLVQATGADRKSVIASTRRLVENGPFSVSRVGAGTRPTEYEIHFDQVRESASSGAEPTTTDNDASSGVQATTGSGVEPTTRAASSGVDTTQTVLHVTAYKADLHDRNIDPAPASPPHAHGLEASAAGSAEDGFEELWRSYGYRQKKADAKEAYRKAAPDTDLHARMVEAAKLWREAWSAQGKPDAPRYTLGKWIDREEFECDPPSVYKPKQKKPTTRREVSRPILPANSNVPPRPSAMTGEIVRADVRGGMLFLSLRDDAGAEREVKIVLESSSQADQEAGQKRFRELLQVVGLDEINDGGDLLGKRLHLTGSGRLKAA